MNGQEKYLACWLVGGFKHEKIFQFSLGTGSISDEDICEKKFCNYSCY